ncbi:hypothetical protein [Agrococcus sp. DT81.2]|uniref:hypothetical protein n=1 Tax=Agrococcus sp. DT81.2 TaxID=3393414 RepID=UPI003CE54D3C
MHILTAQPLPFDPNQVTPGVIGFAVTALIAIAVILLLWDFNRRVRRINDRAEVKERIEAELAAREAQQTQRAEPGSPGDGTP